MPDYRRWRQAAGTYFFTLVTDRRKSILTSPPFRRALHEAWAMTRLERPFETLAVVLLPDHLHCLWRLGDDDDFSTRWRLIKARVTRAAAQSDAQPAPASSRRKRGEATIWQRRFWEHLIRDEADLKRHTDYIHWNPVKHGLVARARDWPYSTFGRYVLLGEYDLDWGQAEPESLRDWPAPPE
jgi:putative transposase